MGESRDLTKYIDCSFKCEVFLTQCQILLRLLRDASHARFGVIQLWWCSSFFLWLKLLAGVCAENAQQWAKAQRLCANVLSEVDGAEPLGPL